MNKQTIISIIQYMWLLLAIVVILWKGVIPGWKDQPADFNNYYVAAKLVTNGESPHQFYENDWFKNQAENLGIEGGAKFSPFPPVTAYIYLPLTIWNPITAKRIWLTINVLLLLVLPVSIMRMTNWTFIKSLLFISLFTVSISSCLSAGQIYFFMSFILLESFGGLYFRNRPRLVGLIVGICTVLKYIPFLFLAYTFKNVKRYHVLFWTIATMVVLSMLVYWLDNRVFISFFEHFQSHIKGNLPGQGQYAIGFQSIDSMLNNLFMFDANKNPFPLVDLPYLKPLIKYLMIGSVILIMFFLVKRSQGKVSSVLISIGLIGAYVLLPASASYHFLLLLWPMLCIFMWLISLKSIKTFAIISVLVWLTFTVQMYQIPNIPKFRILNLLIHYPRFWGLLCLFVVLSFQYFKKGDTEHG